MDDPKEDAWRDPVTGEPLFISSPPSPSGRIIPFFHTIDAAHDYAIRQDAARTARLEKAKEAR